MSPLRTSALALGLLAMACARGTHAQRRDRMPPPAPAIRAGTREPGVGPAPGLPAPQAPARAPRPGARRRPAGPGPPPAARPGGSPRHRDRLVARRAARDRRRGRPLGRRLRRARPRRVRRGGRPAPRAALDARALHAFARERAALRRGRPAAGDLVFLADRPGGPPEHVGLVESRHVRRHRARPAPDRARRRCGSA